MSIHKNIRPSIHTSFFTKRKYNVPTELTRKMTKASVFVLISVYDIVFKVIQRSR